MTAPLCCVCGEQPRFESGVLCKGCKAEIMLTEGLAGIKAVEALQRTELGKTRLTVAIGGPGGEGFAKAVKCEACQKSAVYNPGKKKESYFCDECGRQLCPSCAAYCSHKDWNYQNKILCKNCRAERSLTGQPVEEVEGTLPGQESKEAERIPKPHCGEPTCRAGGEWCECNCVLCKEAVASGFPDPAKCPIQNPPPPAAAPPTQDEIDEEEIARWEGGQQ